MFVIQWVYTLVNMGVAAVVYVYIGRASPGLHLGKQQSHFGTTSLIIFSIHWKKQVLNICQMLILIHFQVACVEGEEYDNT